MSVSLILKLAEFPQNETIFDRIIAEFLVKIAAILNISTGQLISELVTQYNTIIAKRDDKTVTRNVSHFKKVLMEESEEEQEDTAPPRRSTETEEPPKQEPSERRPTRMKRPVMRYQYQT
jgi:hypothetical protein